LAYRLKIFGTIQYQPGGGTAADDWLTAWVAAHSGEIRNHQGNHHTLTSLDPVHPEGCDSQLEIEYHLMSDAPADSELLFQEVTAAIYSPGMIAAGDCDSGWGSETE
jgi:hypothetical protein